MATTIGPLNDFFPSFDFQGFLYQIQRGAVAGYTYSQRHYNCNELSTSIYTAVWNVSPPVIYNFLAAATTLSLSSTSANDTALGTGARTVLVEGLDSNYDIVTETVTLNGQTGVVTANSYLRINNLTVTNWGTSSVNAGKIYIGSGAIAGGVNSIPHSLISPGTNFAEVAVFTVPRGFTLLSFNYNAAVGSGKSAILRSIYRPAAADPFVLHGGVTLFDKGITKFDTTIGIFYELSDVVIQGIAMAGNTQLTVDVQTALVDNKFV